MRSLRPFPDANSGHAALCRSARMLAGGTDRSRRESACCLQDFIDGGTIYPALTLLCQRHIFWESFLWPNRRTNRTTVLSSGSSLSSCWLWAGTGTAAKTLRPKALSRPLRQPRPQRLKPRRKPRHRLAAPLSLLQPLRLQLNRQRLSLQQPSLLRQLGRPLRLRTDLDAPRFGVAGVTSRGQSLSPATPRTAPRAVAIARRESPFARHYSQNPICLPAPMRGRSPAPVALRFARHSAPADRQISSRPNLSRWLCAARARSFGPAMPAVPPAALGVMPC